MGNFKLKASQLPLLPRSIIPEAIKAVKTLARMKLVANHTGGGWVPASAPYRSP
jgi:hypothetical protein